MKINIMYRKRINRYLSVLIITATCLPIASPERLSAADIAIKIDQCEKIRWVRSNASMTVRCQVENNLYFDLSSIDANLEFITHRDQIEVVIWEAISEPATGTLRHGEASQWYFKVTNAPEETLDASVSIRATAIGGRTSSYAYFSLRSP